MEKLRVQIFASKRSFPRFVMPKRFLLKKKIIQRFLKQNFLIKRKIRRWRFLYKVELAERISNVLMDIPKMIGVLGLHSKFGSFEILC
jgi:hypothetical protein